MKSPQITVLLLIVCSLLGISSAIAQERSVTIEVLSSSDSEWDRISAYGFSVWLAAWVAENEDLDSLPVGPYDPPFAALHAAYEPQIELWRKMKESENIQDRYANELIAVSDSEFLDEYIWHFYQSENWGDPGPDVDMEAFLRWAKSHLHENHP